MADTINTTSTSVSEPWGPQQEYLKQIMAEAQKQYQGPGPQYYGGNVTAAVDPATLAAQEQILNVNAPNMQAQADAAAKFSNFLMTDGLDVSKNPYMQAAIQAAINPMMENFYGANGQMSQLRSGAGNAGQYGGSRQGIAEGIATRGLTRGIGDVSSKMTFDTYQQGLNAAGNALQLAPQTQKMQTAAPTAIDAVGTQRQAYAQKLIDDQVNKWNWEQNLPAEKLAVYRNTVTGNYGGTGTSSAQYPGTSSGGWMPGVGAAVTLGSMLI